MPIQEGLKYLCTRGQGRDKLIMHTQEDNAGIERLRTHLTSFAGVQGFEVSCHFAINDRACLHSTVFTRTGIKPASCKAFSFRNRSQMGSIMLVI